jgi:hypothetical protein
LQVAGEVLRNVAIPFCDTAKRGAAGVDPSPEPFAGLSAERQLTAERDNLVE